MLVVLRSVFPIFSKSENVYMIYRNRRSMGTRGSCGRPPLQCNIRRHLHATKLNLSLGNVAIRMTVEQAHTNATGSNRSQTVGILLLFKQFIGLNEGPVVHVKYLVVQSVWTPSPPIRLRDPVGQRIHADQLSRIV